MCLSLYTGCGINNALLYLIIFLKKSVIYAAPCTLVDVTNFTEFVINYLKQLKQLFCFYAFFQVDCFLKMF